MKFENGRTTISFDVKDDHSAISRVEFSSDGQRWRGVFPKDGVADSEGRHYELVVDGNSASLAGASSQRRDEQRRERPRGPTVEA